MLCYFTQTIKYLTISYVSSKAVAMQNRTIVKLHSVIYIHG
jgi:hypothetical protein